MNHQAHQAHQEVAAGIDRIARSIVDAGLSVHQALGAGLLESAYEQCLAFELTSRGLVWQRQLPLPIAYRGVKLDAGYRLDLLVENSVIVEIKAVEALTRLHGAQMLTYLKLSGMRLGLLMNFNVALFKDGVKRFAL
ncbi:MAG TPA: GxxExxY protein [Caulobacteraceae bacterium]|nr:GxxExxY protein [Caulobacteraceae bacterium]